MFKTEEIHIDLIRVGDVIFHDNHERTVCKENIEYGGFMGTSVFGDSYHSGYKPVLRCIIPRFYKGKRLH